MTKIIYKPYSIIFKRFLIKRKIYISNIIYYPIKYYNVDTCHYENLIFQTPVMFIPFSLSDYNSINNYIDISFLNKEKDKDINSFFLFICKLNNYFVNLKKFKKYTFRSSIKQKINIFPERLRLNFNTKNNVMIFDEEKNKIDKSLIKPKMYGKFIIQLSNIWLNQSKNEYGIVWNICQIKLYNNLIFKPEEYLFIDDDNKNNKLEKEINDKNPIYKQYFFMFKIGLSREAIVHKLIQDKLDPTIIDFIIEQKNKTNKNDTLKNLNTTSGININRKNLLMGIHNGDITLKKTKIVKKKTPENKNNSMVPTHEDILHAWKRIVKKK